MKPFSVQQRKLLDLAVLLSFDIGLYFLWPKEVIILFSLGFIWNWTASQDLSLLVEKSRYRFSMLKLVFFLQDLFLKPFNRFPRAFSIIPKILHGGLFWWLVISFIDSDMPYWATFLGSIVYELLQLPTYFSGPQVESKV